MSEKAISLVTAEWEALAGLPYLQVRLYLVLRWYMSVATRRVGEMRRISLQGLCDELYVEPAPGRVDSGSPSKKAVRSALQQLEKHGLVMPCGNGEVLVFLLPKAGGESVRQKSKGHKRGTVSGQTLGHGEMQSQQGFPDEMGHVMGQPQNPIKGHTSEVRVNHPLNKQQQQHVALPVDKSALLVLPLQAEKIAEWLRRQESERGCRSRVVSGSPQIAAWMALAVTGDELHEAYSLAKVDREVTKNRSAINLPFLDIFVRRVLEGRLVCRGKGETRPALWHTDWDGLAGKAAELGVPTWDGREGFVEFQRRVMAAAQAVAYA